MSTSPSRKRKASELEESSSFDGTNPRKSTKSKGRSKKSKAKSATPSEPTDEYSAFAVASEKDPRLKDAFRARTELAPGFDVDYAVTPQAWDQIRQYRNVKLSSENFQVGDIILVNKDANPPPPPAPTFTDAQLLAYQKKHFWVAKIIQCRALSDKHVMLLVAWLYWPYELPNEVKSRYHGGEELILSNALDIIDALSISDRIEVTYWDEQDDNIVGMRIGGERFWRRTFDVNALESGKNAKRKSGQKLSPGPLSQLRTFCRCGKPQNPDQDMFHCGRSDCGQWNHEQCLADEVGQNLWDAYSTDKMDEYVKENLENAKAHSEEAKTFQERMLQPVKALGNFIKNEMEHVVEDGLEAVKQETVAHMNKNAKVKKEPKSPTATTNGHGDSAAEATSPSEKSALGRPKKSISTPTAASWKPKLKIQVKVEDDKPPMAYVEEKAGKKRKWQVRVDCLCCGKVMD